MSLLRRAAPEEVTAARSFLDADTVTAAARIVGAVRVGGDAALREHALAFGDVAEDGVLLFDRAALDDARSSLETETRELLERAAARIRTFAEAQLSCLRALDVPVPGGRAGHDLLPVARAGCYAPGGRYPLPSSLLMSAIPARVAGVREVVVASPKPGPVMLAAAAIADADALLSAGGAQAVAAIAYGTETVPACDLIVGPGNRFVTAAKKLVFGDAGIDMLAGPSELVVLADDSADARPVAADLIAQAEHDAAARPILVTTSERLASAVDVELERQLADLPTAEVARESLSRSCSVVAESLDVAVATCNELAPEHLEVFVEEPDSVTEELTSYGALFVGAGSAEVFGDYCIGPNHVLPTGRTARFTGGLSVFTFLRVATWLRLDDPAECVADAAALARLEGLEGHARAAEAR